MSTNKNGLSFAVKEHLILGNPITRLEAIILFGVPDLTRLVGHMREQGWVIKSKKTPFATAVKRVNDYALLRPPQNLPTREILLTEYWLSK